MKKVLVVFATVFGFVAGFSQQPLTLSEAIALGLENNYSIRIADLNTNIASLNNTLGNAGRLPRVDFNINQNAFRTENPASFSPGRLTNTFGIAANWTLFDGFRIEANKARLELLEEQSGGNAALVIENTIEAIILSYNTVLIARRQQEVLTEVLENSRKRVEYEKFRKDLGAGGTFDLIQFKNAWINDSINLVVQQLNLRNARRNLNLVMGVPVEDEFRLTDKLSEDFNDYEFEDLREKMLSDNNNVKNQYVTNKILREEYRIAKANLYPTIGISANSNYAIGQVTLLNRDPDTSVDNPTFTRSISALDYSAGLSLAFNLYNGGNTRRQIQVASVNQVIGEVQLEEITNTLTNDLRTTWENYRSRREILNLQQMNVDNAQINLELSEERFDSGLINSFDYRTIQIQYLNAQLGQISALADLIETRTELIRLTGGLIRE